MQSLNKFCLLLSLNVLVLDWCMCHPSGAPASACGDLTPQHGHPAQTSASPYTLVGHPFNATEVHLIIESTQNTPFKGFMIQARRSDGSQEPIGKFGAEVEGAHTINCLGGYQNTITHSNRKSKDKLTVRWLVPKDLDESQVVFSGTVLKDARTFWTGLNSEAFKVGAAIKKSTDSPTKITDEEKVEDKSLLDRFLNIVGSLFSSN